MPRQAKTKGGDKSQRLEGLIPVVQDWHLRQLQQQDTFDKLSCIASSRVEGTLETTKQHYGFNLGSFVSACFNHTIDLLRFAIEWQVCAFAQQFMKERGIDVKEISTDKKTILVSDITDELIDQGMSGQMCNR